LPLIASIVTLFFQSAARSRERAPATRGVEQKRSSTGTGASSPRSAPCPIAHVALSGSIARDLDDAGDLDLFIITRSRHVWSVTVAVLVIAKLLGRRDHLRELRHRRFALTLDQQDLFTANQTFISNPDRRDLKRSLRRTVHGAALSQFRPADAVAPVFVAPRALTLVKRAIEWALQLPALPAEAICRVAYRWHLRRRARSWRSPGQVCLGRDYLKLHTQSHRQSVTERFESALAEAFEAVERRRCETIRAR
jgi:hypothetical protein